MAAISGIEIKRSAWQNTAILTLAFWLGSSLLLDFVIMPSLYATGMMAQPSFATAGYSIFWIFNHIELLCAALVLTSVLALRGTQNPSASQSYKSIGLSSLLLAIVLIYTYVLTPEMGALGVQLNLFEQVSEVPATMTQMHEGYWLLEALKLMVGGFLLNRFYCQQQ